MDPQKSKKSARKIKNISARKLSASEAKGIKGGDLLPDNTQKKHVSNIKWTAGVSKS